MRPEKPRLRAKRCDTLQPRRAKTFGVNTTNWGLIDAFKQRCDELGVSQVSALEVAVSEWLERSGK